MTTTSAPNRHACKMCGQQAETCSSLRPYCQTCWEMLREVKEDERPRFAHVCPQCTFLGRCDLDGQHFDLYHCPQSALRMTIIARHGDLPPAYTSGLELAQHLPCLRVALARARRRSLLPPGPLRNVYRFDNGQVAAFDDIGEQIVSLNGAYDQVRDQVLAAADERTVFWHAWWHARKSVQTRKAGW